MSFSPAIFTIRLDPRRRRFWRFAPRTAALLVLLSAAFGLASGASAQPVNPHANSNRAVYAGGVLFRAQCATCHGADAAGISTIDAPDLTEMWQARGYADHEVFTIIQNGVPGTIMPPHDFTDTETWMLVSYLRSVGIQGVEALPTGSSANGRNLFAAQCAQCHRVGRRGGVLGPDLSDLLDRSTLDAITLAIRDPDALVPRGFKTVRVTAADETVTGVLKNEDAFSLQVISEEQRLRAFDKQAVTVSRPRQSLMPSYGPDQLGDQDIYDMLNYIHSASEGEP